MNYLIYVTQTSNRLSDPDDRQDSPAGIYSEKADDEEQALDKFHARIPIGCLDDFEIDICEDCYCPKCHENWIVHDGAGGCVEDE